MSLLREIYGERGFGDNIKQPFSFEKRKLDQRETARRGKGHKPQIKRNCANKTTTPPVDEAILLIHYAR